MLKRVSEEKLRLIMLAVEYGFRGCERGKNLEATIRGVLEIYKPRKAEVEVDEDRLGFGLDKEPMQ